MERDVLTFAKIFQRKKIKRISPIKNGAEKLQASRL